MIEEQKTPTESPEEPDFLTGKQRAFAAAYLANGFNATRAVKEAGYASNSAHAEGWRLLHNPKIMAVISKAFQDKGIAPMAVQILLAVVAFDADMADFEPWIDGTKTLEQLRAEGVDTRAVKSATVSITGTRRIELHDRLAALKELGRILGMVTNKHETETTVTLAQALSKLGNDD